MSSALTDSLCFSSTEEAVRGTRRRAAHRDSGQVGEAEVPGSGRSLTVTAGLQVGLALLHQVLPHLLRQHVHSVLGVKREYSPHYRKTNHKQIYTYIKKDFIEA